MAVFAIIQQPSLHPELLASAVQTHYKDANLPLPGHGWLVSASTTAQQLSAQLGVTEGKTAAAIILEVGGYFGRADPNIWTWIKTNLEKVPGGS